MPHRTSKHGTYRIDRRFSEIGRLAMASGATTKRGFRERNVLLTRLYNRGRLDLLKAIMKRKVSITEVLDADREDRLDTLLNHDGILTISLWETLDQWKPKPRNRRGSRLPKGTTVERYRLAFRQLRQRMGLGARATVGDLADVDWMQASAEWSNSAASWNHLRRALSRFLAFRSWRLSRPWTNRAVFPISPRTCFGESCTRSRTIYDPPTSPLPRRVCGWASIWPLLETTSCQRPARSGCPARRRRDPPTRSGWTSGPCRPPSDTSGSGYIGSGLWRVRRQRQVSACTTSAIVRANGSSMQDAPKQACNGRCGTRQRA